MSMKVCYLLTAIGLKKGKARAKTGKDTFTK